jgi:hypothetical protein
MHTFYRVKNNPKLGEILATFVMFKQTAQIDPGETAHLLVTARRVF